MLGVFSYGVYVGMALAILLEAVFVWGLKWLWRQNELPPIPLPDMDSSEPRIPEYVKNRFRYRTQSVEQCAWFNDVVHKLTYHFIGRDELERQFIEKLTFNEEQLKEKDVTFITYLKILEFQLGNQMPQLKGVQLIIADENQSLVSAALEYDGGIKVVAEAMISAMSIVLQLTINIPLIKGSLAIRSTTKHLSVCFNEPPLIEIKIRFKAGSFVSPKIASFMEKKIKNVILDELVYPGTFIIAYTNYDKDPTHRLKLRFPKCTMTPSTYDAKRKPELNLFVTVNSQRKKTRKCKSWTPDWSGVNLVFDINLKHSSDIILIEMFDNLGGVYRMLGNGDGKLGLSKVDAGNTHVNLPSQEIILTNDQIGHETETSGIDEEDSDYIAKISIVASLTCMTESEVRDTTTKNSDLSSSSDASPHVLKSEAVRTSMTSEDMDIAMTKLEKELNELDTTKK
eukprot:CFRG5827T1